MVATPTPMAVGPFVLPTLADDAISPSAASGDLDSSTRRMTPESSVVTH